MGSPPPFQPFDPGGGTAVATAGDGEFIPVELPSGAFFEVLTEEEAEYLDGKARDYNSGFAFNNVADLGELDRLVCMELLVHRYQRWLSRRKTYDGKAVDEGPLQTKVNNWSTEIRQIKLKLGIDKVTRDRQRGEGSVAQRWTTTLTRAKAFTVMRCQQAVTAITLAQQLIALMDLRNNTDPIDRERLKLNDESILTWVDTRFRDEFVAVRAHFAKTEMHYWHDGRGQH